MDYYMKSKIEKEGKTITRIFCECEEELLYQGVQQESYKAGLPCFIHKCTNDHELILSCFYPNDFSNNEPLKVDDDGTVHITTDDPDFEFWVSDED